MNSLSENPAVKATAKANSGDVSALREGKLMVSELKPYDRSVPAQLEEGHDELLLLSDHRAK